MNLKINNNFASFLHKLMGKISKQPITKIGMVVGTLVVSFSILAFLLFKERETLLSYNWQIEFQYLLLSLILYSAGLFFASLIWANMMKEMGSQVSVKKHIQIFIISNVFKRLPGTVWYVAGRGILYRQQDESAKLATSATAVELAVSIAGGLLLIGFWSDLISDNQILKNGLLVTGVIIFIFLNPKTLSWLFNRINVDKSIQVKSRYLVSWVIAYSLLWVVGGGILFLISKGIFKETLIEDLNFFIGSWTIVGILSLVVFILPSNFGVTELGLTLLLSQIMPTSIAIVLSILSRIILIVFELVWAIIIIFSFKGDQKLLTSLALKSKK